MWQRSCTNISYYKSAFQRPNKIPVRYYYTLSFTFNFCEYASCYFSYCYPYTYTDLKSYLSQITQDKYTGPHVRREKLCTTLGGNNLEFLTITDYKANKSELKARKGIILMARIHPGESNSSFIMQGAINFLISDSSDAVLLRKKFIFKIIPMINVDGVISGNYRCSLSG